MGEKDDGVRYVAVVFRASLAEPGGSYQEFLVTGQARDINGGPGGVTDHPRRLPAWACGACGRVSRRVPRTSTLGTWPVALFSVPGGAGRLYRRHV
jgi:hypothetical protein